MKLRGNDIELKDGKFVYSDTKESTMENWKTRPCGSCNKPFTPEGHDGCIGTLPNIINACCGHGENNKAYIQFHDYSTIRGEKAMRYIKDNKNE